MAQQPANHVPYTFVAKNIARQATTATAIESTTYIVEGEMVLADPQGNVITTTAGTYTGKEKMKIMFRKANGEVMETPLISAKNVTSYLVTPYSAGTDKVVYIGYNGTSGSLEGNSFMPGTEYTVNIRKKGILNHDLDMYTFHKSFGYYNATATSGEAAVARGLVKNAVANFSDKYGVDNFVKFEMLCSSSDAGSDTVAFIEGDTLVRRTSGSVIVAGNYIRVATGVTSPVYYVESVVGDNIYLETPYQGTSTTAAACYKLNGTITSCYFGLKLTGTEHKFDATNLKFKYDKSDFGVSLKSFINTTVTDSVAASLGNGVWQQVRELEWESEDYFGQTSKTDWLMPSRTQYTISGINYNVVSIDAYDNSVSGFEGTPKSKVHITLCIPVKSSSNQGECVTASPVAAGVVKALDLWLTANTGVTYAQTAKLA